ncbi:TraB/GumN family protein [Pseudoxanthomonas mexicana]
MWRVTHGTGNELLIFGTLSPSPASIEWRSDDAKAALSRAQVVLWPPYFTVDVEAGFFGKLSLGYNYAKAKTNPDGRRLKDILRAEDYATWERLRARYLPREPSLEKKRPLVAAEALYAAAIRAAGLTTRKGVEKQIQELLKETQAKLYSPRFEYKLTKEQANSMLKASRSIEMNDVACLTATMDLVDRGLAKTIANANAWATGDIDALDLEEVEKRDIACQDAFSSPTLLADFGVPDIRQSLMASWMRASEHSLKNNATTVALLPISDVLVEGGYLDQLKAAGFEVEASQP